MLMYVLTFLLGCLDNLEKSITEPDDPTTTGDIDSDDSGVSENPEVVEVDPIEEGRTSTTICSAGGQVTGSSIHGSFCYGAVDISPSPKATSSSFTWQPGPYTTVTP